ncbi:MAG: 30S ribosomal protein S4e [Candidatus Diapherotrites archaeon]|nr:30S ribosomal protein S4e [Candidatus Diapherotrites archaeon]
MASRGESKILKRLPAPKTMHVLRKEHKFTVKASSGPHAIRNSVPMATVLRELTGMADNLHEVKRILQDGKVLIDGKIVKDYAFPIGFMDVVSIPNVDKYYRAVYDRKGRLKLTEINRQNAGFKLCKIRNKTVIGGGRIQLNLHDGKNILMEKNKYNVGDVLKIEVPSLNVLDSYSLAKGSVAYVTGGKHAGETGRIEDLVPGTMARRPLAVIKSGEEQFETQKDYVFVLGTKEAAVKVQLE